jgi:hypothetical protein
MNIPDLILRTHYQFFGIKIVKFFDADPNPGSFQPWIQDPGSGMGRNGIRDPEYISGIRNTVSVIGSTLPRTEFLKG